MRILFFCTDLLRYNATSKDYQLGGGWVVSIIQGLRQHCPDWTFGIGCEGNGYWGENIGGLFRYPIDVFTRRMNKLRRKINPQKEAELMIPQIQKCVSDFKPDAIMIFGTETAYGMITKYTNVPVVIHLQGFLTACQNAMLPPGISRTTLYWNAFPNIKRLFWQWYYFRIFDANARREACILENCKHFFGRTEWDKAVMRQYNLDASYTECWEMLRNEFYQNAGTWKPHKSKTIRLISTISTPIYKGVDLILKTAKLLKGRNIDFCWNVVGIDSATFWEKHLKIRATDVCVQFQGRIRKPEELIQLLLSSDIYVHPSYIENSPNSLCEAQMLGIPVIAVNAGGVSSLIQHKETGILVPANDPYMLADDIVRLKTENDFSKELSHRESTLALKRHSRDIILDTIIHELRRISN